MDEYTRTISGWQKGHSPDSKPAVRRRASHHLPRHDHCRIGSALYTEEQLRALKQARTRVRLSIEQQADGSLKGYGFYTGKNRDWEMVDVVQFTLRGSQQVADLGDDVELIWTPAVDGSDILGIPALQAAPQAPHIWVFPPTKAADGIIVNPIYPPEYKEVEVFENAGLM